MKEELNIKKGNKENLSKSRGWQNYNVGFWVIVQNLIKPKLYACIGKITEYCNGSCNVLFLENFN